jgi:hypothetical protein
MFREDRGLNSTDADSLICQYAASEQAFENGLLVGQEVFGVANHGLVLKFIISERILDAFRENILRGHGRA